jgi:hypothetical protein
VSEGVSAGARRAILFLEAQGFHGKGGAMEVDLLATMFGLNQHVLKVNTQGISHEESLIQPKPSGNCLNWVVGHVAATRDAQVLPLLGEKPVWSPGESSLYLRGSKPMTDPARALKLERILRDIETSQEKLIASSRAHPGRAREVRRTGTSPKL